MTNTKADIYSRITSKIVTSLEQGVRPWTQPWNADHAAGKITRPLRASGEAYKGINVLTLWTDAAIKGYACPIWMTYKQAAERGGNVRKGEHGSPVVYADSIKRTDTSSNGQEIEQRIPFLKAYTVFNCEQIEGLPTPFYAPATPPLEVPARIAHAEAFAANTGATIKSGGTRAFYSVTHDYVQMPPFECFRDPESYYATLLHELTHWTRQEKRLNREFGRKRWGDAGYATEELVAEMGSAFLCADLALTMEPREDHAEYIGHWIEVLKSDNRAIFTAAAHAQRAVDSHQLAAVRRRGGCIKCAGCATAQPVILPKCFENMVQVIPQFQGPGSLCYFCSTGLRQSESLTLPALCFMAFVYFKFLSPDGSIEERMLPSEAVHTVRPLSVGEQLFAQRLRDGYFGDKVDYHPYGIRDAGMPTDENMRQLRIARECRPRTDLAHANTKAVLETVDGLKFCLPYTVEDMAAGIDALIALRPAQKAKSAHPPAP